MKTAALLKILDAMTDDQLYETGKLITGLVAQRHSLRVLEGKEIRPGKRGVMWRKSNGAVLPNHKGKRNGR